VGEVTGFVGIAFDVAERRAMMDYVTHLATHDQLTGLIGRAVRSSDTVARLGGDEFVVVMDDITTVDDVELCAKNLVTRVEPEMVVEGHQLHVTASVGVCVYPDFAGDARHLLKWADAAMYSAKENGRNQHQVFSPGMLKDNADRLSMERAMRQGVARNEFRLHYQPQVSLVTGAVVGMEALLRWQHPELGLLLPADFMSLAEDTGLILPIGEWAFKTACMEGRAMRDELGMDLTVSVNLSPRQFQQKNLLEVVETALSESGLPAKNLEIEITENTLMLNSTANLEKLERIRSIGGRIAIDDFGTGFCNFTYLLQYEVDRLKIDQGFIKLAVTDANAAAVVRTIIAMSHGLNIKVIAEGVETEDQLKFLLRRRCDEAQGFLLARPVPRAEFCDTVRACSAVAMLQSA
jgi:EAL domain-containing protein (putative c-di-GMP-specific phosphodiesterase class I)/GGDEF domain-containing protein